MSTTAEDVSATLTSQEANLDATDSIAELLVGEDESETEDVAGEETQTQASTQDDDEESNEDGEAEDGEEETTLEAVAEEDELTWESTLGAEEGQLSFDDDGNITGFVTKVNGESETVDAKTLIAGFQNNKAFTMKSQAHAEEVKEFEVRKEQIEQEYTSKLESVDALSQHFERQLISEFDNVNWEQLRVTDPAEYAALRQDFSTKAGELSAIKEAIATDKASAGQKAVEEQQVKSQAYMKEQFDLMIGNNPEWSDKKVLEKAHDEFRGFVKDNYGFKDQEFDSVFDARLIELIKDAKKYHEGAKVASKKRQKPVPKFQKSVGGGVKPKTSKLDKLTAASKKAHGDDKRNLQASAVAELLTGG